MWSFVYLRPSDFLVVDECTEYTSREMRVSLEAPRQLLDETPIKVRGAIGTAERYHAPLRLAYERIRTEAGVDTSDQKCLQLAVFSINSTIGPD